MQIIELVPDLRPTILAARQVNDPRNTLSRFLPNVAKNQVSYRLGRRKAADQTVPIRAIDAPAIPIRQPGLNVVSGGLPAITPLVNLTEQDLTNDMVIAQQLAGLEVNWQPAVDSAAGAAALTVDNTLEQMRGQLLSTGVVSLVAEDGAAHLVDFEIPTANKIAVGSPWDPSTSAGAKAIFADFTAGHGRYRDSAGSDAGVALTTRAVADLLLAAVQSLYPNAPIGFAEVNGYLANRGLPSIEVYGRRLTNFDGTKVDVYPKGSMTFLPGVDAPVGQTELGVTQEAVQQVQAQVLAPTEAPGVTIVTLGRDNPVQRAVKAAAIGLPVLRDNEDIVILSGLVAP